MKKIEAIIHPFKLDDVKDALMNELEVDGMTVSEVRGVSRGQEQDDSFRGSPYVVDFRPHLRIEAVVPDGLVDLAVTTIRTAAVLQGEASGMIFVLPVDDAVRIRTGERGDAVV